MPTEDLHLRPGRPQDADEVAEVHLAARRAAHETGTMPAGVHPDEETRRWVHGWLGEEPVWVAEAEGRVVGYARFPGAWLDDLYVLPERQGHGVGSALLDLVKAQRPGGFCLWVFETNRPARDFYARRGLVELERTDGSANEERAPDVRLAWPGTDPRAFLRTLVDDVDDALGDLLARRAALTRVIQQVKHDAARDPAREREIAARVAARAPELGVDRVGRIVHSIITESLHAAGS